jgi:hypothetical protein
MTTLTIWCLVEGESTPFSVMVPSDHTVDGLKKLIEAEIPKFKDIAAHDLILWRISIPILPKNDQKEIYLSDVASPTELDETAKISNVFDAELPEDTIHILVQPPGNATYCSMEALVMSLTAIFLYKVILPAEKSFVKQIVYKTHQTFTTHTYM